MNINDVQAIEKVLTKTPFFHFAMKILIGSRDNADVRIDRSRSAEPLEFAVLQDAQQLDLNRRRDFTDFVEEKGTAIGQLESSFFTSIGAGKCTFFIAEQFRFEQCFG